MVYRLLAVCILLLFYAVYFCKALIQKRKGITTRQIGKRKEKDIHTVEVWMSVATLCTPVVQLLSIVMNWSWTNGILRITGFCIGMIGDALFLTAVITMKNSWRAGIPESDKTELILNGIYRWSRNPAFLGFDCMYVGVCLLFCNPLTILFSLFAICMLHLQILQEEKYLLVTFGQPYADYKECVLRYFGRRFCCKQKR